MIRKYNDDTFENGVCYECFCDRCRRILDDVCYGKYEAMYCKECFIEEEIVTVKELQEGETMKCSSCELEIEEGIVMYEDCNGKWMCEECFEEAFKKDVSDAISDYKYWSNIEP